MEGNARHRVWVLLAVAVLLQLLAVGPARAADPFEDGPVDVQVNTGPDQVIVDARTGGAWPGSSGETGSGSGGSGSGCYLREIPSSEWTDALDYAWVAYRMRYTPYYLCCNGEKQGVVWIENSSGQGSGAPAPARDPRDIAMQLRDEIPIPRASVKVNPSQGLVGVESWYWMEGYDGAPIAHSTDAFGRLVEVQARVTRYDWSFGDGASVSSATGGHAYPARSEVRHVYERSSLGHAGGYAVDVRFSFAVRYRVAGGAWSDLPGITRQAHAGYPVRESQAVIQQ